MSSAMVSIGALPASSQSRQEIVQSVLPVCGSSCPHQTAAGCPSGHGHLNAPHDRESLTRQLRDDDDEPLGRGAVRRVNDRG
jgi:hypothetical protein